MQISSVDIEIDNFPLIKRIEDSQTRAVQELRTVYSISIDAKRAIVEHKILGANSSVLQDMGRYPARITFEGDLIGTKSKDSLQSLWVKFQQGKPVPFSSDITGITDITSVMIENLAIDTTGGNLFKYHYFISLTEYKPPKQPEDQSPPSQADDAKDQVEAESEIHDIRGRILDRNGNPASGVKVKISGPDGDREITTDDQGNYQVQDLPSGKYTVTVDEKGYSGLKKEVEIQKGEGSGNGQGSSQSNQGSSGDEGSDSGDQTDESG